MTFELMFDLDEAAVLHRGEPLGDVLRAAHSAISRLSEENRQLRAALLFDPADGSNQARQFDQ